jgi:mRNA interferase MazF
MYNYIKHFDVWSKIKIELDNLITYPKFQEGDVWWCHIGENIGHEECGKGNKFLRPVVVLKKFNNRIFFGIPTSSKLKDSPFYRPIKIKRNIVSVLMSQMRLFDVKRLLYKQSKISPNELNSLRKDFIKLLIKK